MGSIPIVNFLLEAGADVTLVNNRGLTPLQVRKKIVFNILMEYHSFVFCTQCARLERREPLLGPLKSASNRIVAERIQRIEQAYLSAITIFGFQYHKNKDAQVLVLTFPLSKLL